MNESIVLRVQRVRYQSAKATVISGLAINADGGVVVDARRYSATVPAALVSVQPERGQWWQLAGKPMRAEYTVDGYRVVEHRFIAQEAQLLRPSGEHIVQLLSTSPAFPGIGEVKARRLWDTLGEALYDALDNADHAAFSVVLGQELAEVLLAGWQQYGDADVLRWFQKAGMDLRLSRKLLAVYGGEALEAIETDPYRLLGFGMSWNAVDCLAQRHFKLSAEDERRLVAAVEAVLYRAFDAGDTYCDRAGVEVGLVRMIGQIQIEKALALAELHHCVHVSCDRIHALGPYLIEQRVAAALGQRLGATVPIVTDDAVETLLDSFEREEAATLGCPNFALNAAQRRAVRTVAQHPLVLISGGAGVGKTTVINAVHSLFDDCGWRVYAMALSGRAAKRLAEAIHRPAMTIAGFLRNVAPDGVPDNSVLIIDEASMLDILLAYRLLNAIPDSCRIILVGDPFQLPPVGPGLTLHSLVSVATVPRVELTEVRRFGGTIATVAQAVREGRWVSMSAQPEAQMGFLSCSVDEVVDLVLKHYLTDPLNTQVLTFTRERGTASAKTLNAACQGALTASARRLLTFNLDRDRQEDSGLRLGDPVLCTRNLWACGIQNGSLGRIDAIEDVPQPIFNLKNEPTGIALAWACWDDGERRPVTEDMLDSLELGYAVTVHKAQGSQFARVIIPVYPARNLDRTMLYTAITRATTQVLLVGDADVARRAVEALPHAFHRKVALAGLLQGGN